MLSLETERLVPRDFLTEDWDAFNALLSDPEVMHFMHFASWDEAERRAWFEWLLQNASSQDRDAYDWAVTFRQNGTLIGWFGIGTARDPVEAAKGARSCGYVLDRAHTGARAICPKPCEPFLPTNGRRWEPRGLLRNAERIIRLLLV